MQMIKEFQRCVLIFVMILSVPFVPGCASLNSNEPIQPIVLNDVEKEFLTTDFKIIKDRNELRKDILEKFTNSVPIANPGGVFNSGCIIESKVPSQMLIFAGDSKDMAFVYYAQGGIAVQHLLYLVKYKGQEKVFESGYYLPGVEDLNELKAVFVSRAQRK